MQPAKSVPDPITREQWESEEHPRDEQGQCLHPASKCFGAVKQALSEQGVTATQAADVLRSMLEVS